MTIARLAAAFALALALEVATSSSAPAAVTGPPLSQALIDLRAAAAQPALTPQQQQQLVALEHQLTPAQFARLQPAIRAVRDVLTGKTGGDPVALASQDVPSLFPGASVSAVNALLCIVLAEAAIGAQSDVKDALAKLQALTAAKQTPDVQSAEGQLKIQMLQSQYAQIEQTVSNMLKSMSNTQTAIINNLKG
jgi:hypothetical protein